MIKRITLKFKNGSPAVKASMALLVSNIILKGLSMISGPIFTRIMTPEQYGMVANFVTWQNLIGTVVTLNLAAGVFNNGMMEFEKNRDRFQVSLASISMCTSLLFLGIIVLFHGPLVKILNTNIVLLFFLPLYYFFVPLYSYWSARQRYEFKYKALFIVTVASAVISLFLSVIAVLVFPKEYTATAKIIASELPSIILGAFALIYIISRTKFNINIKYIKYAIKFNIPLIPHYLSIYVLASADRIMITKMVSSSATAIYSVSYTVGMVINILWQSIEASLTPWVYEKLNAGALNTLRKRTFQILMIFLIICLVSCLFAPEIIWILAPKEYYEGIYVIPAIAASAFFISTYSFYMRIELYHKKTVFATVATTLAAGLNLILNFIFIKLFGYVAAGYTTLICYILLTMLHYLNVKKWGYDDCIDNKRVFLLSALMITCSLTINVLYRMPKLRYLTIVIIVIMGVANKKTIALAIKG